MPAIPSATISVTKHFVPQCWGEVTSPSALSQVVLSPPPSSAFGGTSEETGDAPYSPRELVTERRGKSKLGEAVSDLLPASRCSQELNSSTFILTQQRCAGDKVSRRASTGVSNPPLLSFKLHLLSSFRTSAVTGRPKQLNPTYFFLLLFLEVELSCVGQRLGGLDWILIHMRFPLRTRLHSSPLPQTTLATHSTNSTKRNLKAV